MAGRCCCLTCPVLPCTARATWPALCSTGCVRGCWRPVREQALWSPAGPDLAFVWYTNLLSAPPSFTQNAEHLVLQGHCKARPSQCACREMPCLWLEDWATRSLFVTWAPAPDQGVNWPARCDMGRGVMGDGAVRDGSPALATPQAIVCKQCPAAHDPRQHHDLHEAGAAHTLMPDAQDCMGTCHAGRVHGHMHGRPAHGAQARAGLPFTALACACT